ncbi:MAG TPA: hypothetical protein VIY28_08915 [Pseudonocardiaceae bacterium]
MALTPFVHAVLSVQHGHARKQTDHLLFERLWRYLLFASELVDQLFKVL